MQNSQAERRRRVRLQRAIPTKDCWSALVFFDPDAEQIIKSIAAHNRVGVGPLIERWVGERLKQEQWEAVCNR